MRKIFKGLALTVVTLSVGMTVPVYADVTDVEKAFEELNGNGGTIQVSEFSPYEGLKNIRIVETVDIDSDNSDDFIDKVLDKIKEIGMSEDFEYDCICCDMYLDGNPTLANSSTFYFDNDIVNVVYWGNSGSMTVLRISDGTVIKETGNLTDVVTSNSQSTDASNLPSASESTLGEQNAYKKALSYLDYTAFSYSGLIKQLEYEGFSTEEATYGVDNCGADWNEQAAKKAQSYLEYTSFSRDGLIKQLEYEGFTKEQAEYGVSAVGF